MSVEVNKDLDLRPEQVLVLVAIHGVSLAIGAFATEFGLGLQTAMAPILTQAIGVALTGSKCPFDAPPTDIVEGYDSKRNRYLHCLHPIHHCWSWQGRYIACPS